MKYSIVEDGIYLNDQYHDVHGNRHIYTPFQSKRKKNRKYFVYEASGNVVTGQKCDQIQIIDTHLFKQDLVAFYFDMQGRMAFIVLRKMQEDKLLNYLTTLDLKPRFRLFHWILLSRLLFFGFFVVRQDKQNVMIQIGYNKMSERKVHFLFPYKVRQYFVGKSGKIPILFQFGYFTIHKQQLVDIYTKTSEINVPLYLKTYVNQTEYSYPLKYSGKEQYSQKHYLFTTRDFKIQKKMYMFIRKSVYGQIVLVHTSYLPLRIKLIEKLAYVYAKVHFISRKYDIYFEKFCDGASESGFYLFEYAIKQNDPYAYYILSDKALNYQSVKQKYGKRILKKNSFAAFYHLFKADKLISSDLVTHIQRRLYDNSRLIKRVIYTCHNKIFLQHGVSLATNLFARGYYNKRVPIAPDYIVVSSQREKQLFLKHSLYRSAELWHTGVPNLDLYVTETSQIKKDEITFLLTWRPWDLHGTESEASYLSRYFQFFEQVKTNSFYQGKKVNLVLHPKAKSILETTYPKRMQELSHMIYDGSINKVLKRSKVVVSDYSSVVFYAFAAGSNIVFFWGDKEAGEAYYGAPNLLQEKTAFGEVCYDIAEMTKCIMSNYDQSQTHVHQMIFQQSVDCVHGNNAEATYAMIQDI